MLNEHHDEMSEGRSVLAIVSIAHRFPSDNLNSTSDGGSELQFTWPRNPTPASFIDAAFEEGTI